MRKPTLVPNRHTIPDTLDCADWSQLESLFTPLQNASLDTPDALKNWLQDFSDLTAAIYDHGSRCNIAYACHTDDPEKEKAYMHFVQEIAPKIAPIAFALHKKALESPHWQTLEPQRFSVMFREWQSAVDLFREENVPLKVQDTQKTSEYDKCIGQMTVDYDGKTQTLQQLARYQENTDRAVREETWRLSVERRLQDRERLDAIFDEQLNLRNQVAKNANCANYRDYVFLDRCRFDYAPEDCLAFGDAVEQWLLPIQRKLDESRQQAMGVEHLRPWDMSVDPQGRAPLYPFDADNPQTLYDKSLEVFRRVSPMLADEFATLQFGRNLDLDSRKGKRGGGFQASLALTGEPFIFMNAAGLQRDVETMLHEAGHAFHYIWAWRNQPLCFLDSAPLEFCEVASMSMELICMDHFDVYYDSIEAVQRAKRKLLEGIVDVLPWVATIDGYQHWLYTHPDHTREQRTQAWLDVFNRFSTGRIDWSGLEQAREALWHRQLHLYHCPFYYIEYGIAQLGALQLWLNYRQDPKGTLESYRDALSLGNTRPLPELFEAAGLNFAFDAATIQPMAEALQKELEV